MQQQIQDPKKKVVINNVKNRFLFIPPSVAAGLEPEAKIEDFKVTQELGEGSFGKVLKVTHRNTGKVYAIKAIDKRNKTNQQGKPYFRREIEIMYKVHHPNAIKLYTHFEDDTYCYFVMELASKGNLYELMQKRKGSIDQATIIQYMRELIAVVYYLHHMDPPIIHRDIKPENVLIAENGAIKLTDFGWSNFLDSDNSTRSTYCGTPLYLAPEMISELGHDEYLDIWCLGVLMFELITGNLPFTGKNIDNLSGNILKNKIQWPNDIGPEEKDLLSKILKTNPNDRLSLKAILAHPYFAKVKMPSSYNLVKPNELEEDLENDIYLLSLGTTNNPNAVKKVKSDTKIVSAPISASAPGQFDQKTPKGSDNVVTEFSKQGGSSDDTLRKEVLLYKQKVERLESNVKDLEKAYLEEKKAVKDLTQQNEDLKAQIQVLNKNKSSLLTDLDEMENLKLTHMRTVSELKDKLTDKDNKNKNILRTCALLEEKNSHLEEDIKRLEKLVAENDENIDKLNTEHLQKVTDLQRKLQEALEHNDEKLDSRITLIRDSISEMTTINPTTKYTFGQENEEEIKKKIEEEYEAKLNKLKAQFTENVQILQTESLKEKEKYGLLIKEKDKELLKLLNERKNIKEQIAKQYEKALAKSDLTVKLKDSEIEKLNTQLKRYEQILELNNLKKK